MTLKEYREWLENYKLPGNQDWVTAIIYSVVKEIIEKLKEVEGVSDTK